MNEHESPRTEAGRRLLKLHREERTWPSLRNDPDAQADGYVHYCVLCHARERRYPCKTVSLALAIEAEAVATREGALATAVEGIIKPEGRGLAAANVTSYNIALRDVLRLIRGEAEPTPPEPIDVSKHFPYGGPLVRGEAGTE